jgi:hypothetical protein
VGETHDIEDCAGGVVGELILGGVSNKALFVGEGNPRRCDTVTCKGHMSDNRLARTLQLRLTLVVDNDLNLAVLHDTHARVGGSKIDSNNGALDLGRLIGLDGLLVISLGWGCQHQAGDENKKKVQSDAPCRALARRPPRHCEDVLCGNDEDCRRAPLSKSLSLCGGAKRSPGYQVRKRRNKLLVGLELGRG